MNQNPPPKTPTLSDVGASKHIHTVADARRIAKKRIPKMMFEFIDGAAGEGYGEALNREIITKTRLQSRSLANVENRTVSHSLFGNPTGTPFGIAPMGMCNLAWPQTDQAFARLARDYSMPVTVSTTASTSMEEMQEVAEGNAWFQLYVSGTPSESIHFVDRAEAAGYDTIVFTVDVPQVSRRPRELRSGFKIPFKMGPREFLDFALHPQWSLTSVAKGVPEPGNYAGNQGAYDRKKSRGGADWDFLKTLRDHWKGKLVVKGVLSEEDAVRIRDAGVDAIQVSSHGGRQLDSAVPPIVALQKIRKAVGKKFPLFYDSGIRHGEDIVTAYALGADFVFAGRPFLYGSAADGERGLKTIAALFCEETSIVLAQLGITAIDQVTPEMVVPTD